MAPAFRPVEYYTTKFYEKSKGSKRFMELSEEDIENIKKDVIKRKEMMDDNSKNIFEKITKLDNYQRTLQYLTCPLIHFTYESFDERAAFLILMVDPELTAYREYLKLDLMSMSDITSVEDEKEKERLLKQRRQTLIDFQSKVRNIIGFYVPNLLKYEEMYFNKFCRDKELVTEVGNRNQEFLMFRSKAIKDFDSVSDERFEELKELAQSCIALANDKYNTSTATYNVINQKKLLGLKSLAEQLTLFILLVDSDLDMLRIYEEESRMNVVEDRITEQFDYYHVQLLMLERLFHKRFCPDKVLSAWSI